MSSDTAWLIERHIPGNPPEWAGDDHEAPRMVCWVRDANDAIRFSREQDAESIMAILHLWKGTNVTVFVSEHAWPQTRTVARKRK